MSVFTLLLMLYSLSALAKQKREVTKLLEHASEYKKTVISSFNGQKLPSKWLEISKIFTQAADASPTRDATEDWKQMCVRGEMSAFSKTWKEINQIYSTSSEEEWLTKIELCAFSFSVWLEAWPSASWQYSHSKKGGNKTSFMTLDIG